MTAVCMSALCRNRRGITACHGSDSKRKGRSLVPATQAPGGDSPTLWHVARNKNFRSHFGHDASVSPSVTFLRSDDIEISPGLPRRLLKPSIFSSAWELAAVVIQHLGWHDGFPYFLSDKLPAWALAVLLMAGLRRCPPEPYLGHRWGLSAPQLTRPQALNVAGRSFLRPGRPPGRPVLCNRLPAFAIWRGCDWRPRQSRGANKLSHPPRAAMRADRPPRPPRAGGGSTTSTAFLSASRANGVKVAAKYEKAATLSEAQLARFPSRPNGKTHPDRHGAAKLYS